MKSIDYTPTEGADAGKRFIITRMSAFAADKWARRLVKALAKSCAQTPDHVLQMGMGGLAGMGMAIFGNLDDGACDEAYDGLDRCITIRRGTDPAIQPTPLLEPDIDDPMTLTHLRTEAFKLHVDFLKAAASQISPLVVALMPEGKNDAPQREA